MWNLVTFSYGGNIFSNYQKFISNLLKSQGLKSFEYDVEFLKNTEVYKNNVEYFTENNKYGWCSWKPILLLETMKVLDDGDKILLCDVEDLFHPEIFNYVDSVMEDDPCLFVLGFDKNKKTTKRDCFVFMDCDDEDYWNSPQLEAGVTFWKVCDESKRIINEWLKWCLDERVNGEDSHFSQKENFPEFSGYSSKDQSILTNLAIKEGLFVDNGTIRNYMECNADYWYDRYFDNKVNIYRPIDQYMIQIQNQCPYIKGNLIKHSLVLTVHNKEFLIKKVIDGIVNNTTGDYELILVFDGCIDQSEKIASDMLENIDIDYKILYASDVFETKSNNIGLRECTGRYAIIIQDDMVIQELGWNRRMQKPFLKFDDVFAVTARTSHNWIYNEDSKHIGMLENLDNCYCDILIHCDHSDKSNTPRDTFSVRGSVNRGPLMMNLDDLKTLNYFDEEYAPLDMDDHDLMFRARTELNKVCGCYWINYQSESEWGGTRINGFPAPWYLKSQHKNVKIFYDRYKDVLESYRIIENRKVS